MNEQSLFEYLKQNYWKDLEQSEDKFSSWDCFFKIYKYTNRIKMQKKTLF